MTKSIQGILLLSGVLFSSISFGQCPAISCPSDIVISLDSNSCDAIVNYTAPVGVDTCSYVDQTFSYTGSEQIWVVPAGVNSIRVSAYGAQGGANWVNNDNFGGRVEADLAVTPSTTIYVYVGEQATTLTGGWNGGGFGEGAGKGGGGASDIRIGGNALNNRMIVAGGAGGAGYWNALHVNGGIGGGLIGGYGGRVNYATNPGGEPGTQVGSGNGTCVSFNNPACTGGFGYGGGSTSCGCEGYGGGGGWYGGAGSGNCRGGGGGSSYTDPSATNVIHTQGVRVGNGEVVISYPNSSTTTTSQIAGLASGSTFPLGTSTISYVVVAGPTSDTCSFDVIVVDSIAPSIEVPANLTVCGSGPINGLAPVSTWDNCPNPNVSYSISGATTANGFVDASGTSFNPGTSLLWYYIVDASGNADSALIVIEVNALPVVTIAAFSSDTICVYDSPITLPAGTPSNGTYTGNGVSGVNFDPALSGTGSQLITYTYTDGSGCVGSASTAIFVDGCLSLDESTLGNTVLYPNPTSGLLNVQLAQQSAVDYFLYTADGRLVQQGSSAGDHLLLHLEKEESGMYFLELKSEGSERTFRVIRE